MSKETKQLHEDELPAGSLDPETGREIDPVCGMIVRRHAFYRTTYDNQVYKFCNEDCLKTFIADPMKYISSSKNVVHKHSEAKTPNNINQEKQQDQANKEEGQKCCCNNKDEIK